MIALTPEEIKRRLDELAREYIETHNPKIAVELYRLARELEKMERESPDKIQSLCPDKAR
jgi:uncharacterized protein YcbK (DUF882 family)